MHGHWSPTYHTLKYLTDLYQVFLKQNTIETNFIHKDDYENHNTYLDVSTYLSVSDLFENPNKTENMLSGGIIKDDYKFLYVIKYSCYYIFNKHYQFGSS